MTTGERTTNNSRFNVVSGLIPLTPSCISPPRSVEALYGMYALAGRVEDDSDPLSTKKQKLNRNEHDKHHKPKARSC